MPIKFSDLAKATKPAVLDLGDGDTINFRFRHGQITPRMMHDLISLADAGNLPAGEMASRLLAISEYVARLVTEWDVLDTDGSMFQLEVARLAAEIPMGVQTALLQACMQEMNAQGEASAPEGSASKPRSGATS